MNRLLTLLLPLVALSLAAIPSLRADSGFAGEWKGQSDGETPFAMHLVEEDGVLSGTIDVPSQGTKDVPLELKVEGSRISGSFTLSDGTKTSFQGVRAEDGTVSGAYQQDYNSGTFEMRRVGKSDTK